METMWAFDLPDPSVCWGQTVSRWINELSDRLRLRVLPGTAEPFLLVDEIVQHRGEFANCAVQFRQNPPLIG